MTGTQECDRIALRSARPDGEGTSTERTTTATRPVASRCNASLPLAWSAAQPWRTTHSAISRRSASLSLTTRKRGKQVRHSSPRWPVTSPARFQEGKSDVIGRAGGSVIPLRRLGGTTGGAYGSQHGLDDARCPQGSYMPFLSRSIFAALV